MELSVPRALNAEAMAVLGHQSSSTFAHAQAIEMLAGMRLLFRRADGALRYERGFREACLQYGSEDTVIRARITELNRRLEESYIRLAQLGPEAAMADGQPRHTDLHNNPESPLAMYICEALYHARVLSDEECYGAFQQLYVSFEASQLPRLCEIALHQVEQQLGADQQYHGFWPFWRARRLRSVRRIEEAIGLLELNTTDDQIEPLAKGLSFAELSTCYSDLHQFERAYNAADAAAKYLIGVPLKVRLGVSPWWMPQMSEDQSIAEQCRMAIESGNPRPAKAWLLCLRAVAERRNGRAEQALETLGSLTDKESVPEEVARRALRQAAEVHLTPEIRDVQKARSLLKGALDFALPDDKAAEARIELLSGRAALLENDLAAAKEHLLRARGLNRETPGSLEYVSALVHLGHAYTSSCDFELARENFETAFSELNRRRPSRLLGSCVMGRALLALRTGKSNKAVIDFEAAIKIFDLLNFSYGKAQCLRGLAEIAINNNRFAAALSRLEKALAISVEHSSRAGQAHAMRLMGICKVGLQDNHWARELFGSASAIYEELGDRLGIANCLLGLAQASRVTDEAWDSALRAQRIYEQLGYMRSQAIATFVLGDVMKRSGKRGKASELYGQAATLFSKIGIDSAIRFFVVRRTRQVNDYGVYEVPTVQVGTEDSGIEVGSAFDDISLRHGFHIDDESGKVN
jgi:tetratricopeptide (TPR) repeat protein